MTIDYFLLLEKLIREIDWSNCKIISYKINYVHNDCQCSIVNFKHMFNTHTKVIIIYFLKTSLLLFISHVMSNQIHKIYFTHSSS